ncbi:DUF2795 domain-containing protein [Streptomyces sp. NPDC017082]|uniref:DUF2795 domain-containing protein n=1 Tax=Streptomyces sp. NPDC017082 TaxID=3364974 RepID=UPI00378D6411
MKHELEGRLRAGRPRHVEEATDPEPPADDDLPVGPGGAVQPPGAEREQARSAAEAEALRLALARHLEHTAFPAGRERLLEVLAAHHAPAPCRRRCASCRRAASTPM